MRDPILQPVFPLAELPRTAALLGANTAFHYTPGSNPNVTAAEVDAALATSIQKALEGDLEEAVLAD